MFFCFNFNAKNFVQLKKLLVALAFVQATNLFIFMDALVDESVVFSAGRNWTYEMSLCFNETVNVSEHFVKCFSRTTGQYDILQSASPYLYPFIMEYLMLVIECVFHWFLNNADRAENGQPAVSTTNDENATGTTYGSINTEEQPHREANGASTSDVIQSTSVTCFCYMYNHFVACCKGYPGLFITVAVFILFSLGFVILGVYNLVLGNIDYLNAFMIYRLVYWVVLTALAVVGQCVLFCFFSSEQRNLNGFEYLVIMSCIGPIVQSILTIVADVQTEGLLLPLNMFLAEAIFNIIQICTQLAFFGHIRSMKTHENTENNKISCLILMGIIWCFVVSNFALWAEDSFIETRSSVTSWQKQYFDKWPLIYNIFNPLALMFRFNSALLFLNILFDKRLLQ